MLIAFLLYTISACGNFHRNALFCESGRNFQKMKYYLALKKESLPLVKTWMNLDNVMLGEISQTQKEKKKKLHDLTYMWNFKKLNT